MLPWNNWAELRSAVCIVPFYEGTGVRFMHFEYLKRSVETSYRAHASEMSRLQRNEEALTQRKSRLIRLKEKKKTKNRELF